MMVIATLALALLLFQSPRAAATVMTVASVAALVACVRRSPLTYAALRPPTPALGLFAFAGFAFLSVIWSVDRLESATKPPFLVLLIIGTAALALISQQADRALRCRIAVAAVAALAVGLALAAFESLSDQSLTRAIYTAIPRLQKGVSEHIKVVDGVVTFLTETNIKRRIGLFTLLVWPGLLLAACVFCGPRRIAAFAIVASLALIMIFIGPHQSSWVAAAASIVVFALAQLSRIATRMMLAAAFAAWVLLTLPLVWTAHKLELHQASWVPHSARHRVVIWNVTANEVLKAPLLGVGANATRKIFEDDLTAVAASGKPANAASENSRIELNRHAHNAYVQIWFELGAAGALLLTIGGVMIVSAIGRLPRLAQPFALAQFTATAAVMSSSYGIWQLWFLASMAMGAVALLFASTLAAGQPEPVRNDNPL